MVEYARSAVFSVSLLTAALASAHHSQSMYDLKATRTVEGVVTEYEWANPHVYIHVQGESDGVPSVWQIEASPPSGMSLYGWSAQSLAPGDRVTAVVNPRRSHAGPMVLGKTLTTSDGATRQLTGPPATPPATPSRVAASSIAGNWLPSGEGIQRFLIELESWPVTDRGKASLESYTDADNPARNCVPAPPPLSMIFQALTVIDVHDGVVSIRNAAIVGDVERIVHMNAASHDGAPFSFQGHSIGHWEGDALVVDTDHFLEHREGNTVHLASSREKLLTERFELSPDRTQLRYSYVLEDPVYLAEPIRGTARWTYRPDLEYAPRPCNLENAGRYLNEAD